MMSEFTEDLIAGITDESVMRQAFEQHFSSDYPDMGFKVESCRIENVVYQPGKKCSVIYHVTARDRNNRLHDQWFHGVWLEKQPENKQFEHVKTEEECTFRWKTQTFWPEWQLLVYAFPYDKKLRGLKDLIDPEFIRAGIEQHRESFGVDKSAAIKSVRCEKIKYRPGKRCILRYQADLDGVRESRLSFYGKTYSSTKSRYVFDTLQWLANLSSALNLPLAVPAPILHLDGYHTYWQWEWSGRKLAELGRELGWSRLMDRGLIDKVAEGLAALHTLPFQEVILHQQRSTWDMLKDADAHAVEISRFMPQHRSFLQQVLHSLQHNQEAVEAQERKTFIHGSFKLAQIIYNSDRLAVVDFDQVGVGDPFYDVAEFLSSLYYLEIKDALTTEQALRLTAAFVRAYGEHVQFPIDHQALCWYQLVFLLGKINSSLKRLKKDQALQLDRAFHRMKSLTNELS